MTFNDNLLDSSYFHSAESSASLQPDRFQPELRRLIPALHVNMSRLVAVTGVKKEPIWPDTEYRRHFSRLAPLF
jgi:hypothetical protein